MLYHGREKIVDDRYEQKVIMPCQEGIDLEINLKFKRSKI